ncbi:MAG: DUF1513 domain-containing protein, partial [Spongiibacteraceae bacterium]
MHRREFLLAGALFLSLPRSLIADTRNYSPIISATRQRDGKYFVGAWQKTWQAKQATAQRGHASGVNRQRHEWLFFARRPGREIHIVDSNSGQLKQIVSTQPGYHLYGHGCLSHDGNTLYTSENNTLSEGTGAIGIYDAKDNYRYLGHHQAHGIGPHEIALLPDGQTLVVAVGGIKTLPESGRKTLNFDTMQPSLNYIDRTSGELLERQRSPNKHLSLRHLAVAKDGSVIVGAQFQGAKPSSLPLVYRHHREGRLQALGSTDQPLAIRQDYIASVAVDDKLRRAVTSLPRDKLLAIWDLGNNTLEMTLSLRDCAGVVYDPKYRQFILSTGHGKLMALADNSQQLTPLAYIDNVQWDNHLSLADALRPG